MKMEEMAHTCIGKLKRTLKVLEEPHVKWKEILVRIVPL